MSIKGSSTVIACNESLDFQQAISHALQQLPTVSMVLQTFNSPLDASLSWLAFFYQTMLPYGGYNPQRIYKG